jgi:hypothetical protein
LGKNDPPVFDHEFVGEHLDLTRRVFGGEIDPLAVPFSGLGRRRGRGTPVRATYPASAAVLKMLAAGAFAFIRLAAWFIGGHISPYR